MTSDSNTQEQSDISDVKTSSSPHIFKRPSDDILDNTIDNVGKKRRFAHVEGNWPSLVYIPVPSKIIEKATSKVSHWLTNHGWSISIGSVKLNSFLSIETDPTATLFPHVSLSKPFVLRQHEISSFISLLRKEMKTLKQFDLHLCRPQLYPNEDRSRTFIACNVDGNHDKLLACIQNIDESLQKFGQPTYYENPQPHISIAWTNQSCTELEKCDNIEKPTKRSLLLTGYSSSESSYESESEESTSDDEDECVANDPHVHRNRWHITYLCVKTGNQIHNIYLE